MERFILIMLLAVFLGMLWAEKTEPNPYPTPEVLQARSDLKYRFEKRDTFQLIGIEEKDFMMSNDLMELWKKFMHVEGEIPNQVAKTQYGVSYFSKDYEPKTMKGYNYFIGLEVSSLDKVPDGMLTHIVPPASYVVFDHHGSVEDIPKTYEYIYGPWMKASGSKPAESDTFEMYGERFDTPDDPVVEIWVPILK